MSHSSATTVRRAEPRDLDAVLGLDEELFRHDMQFDSTLDPAWTRSGEGVQFFAERLSGAEGAAWVVELEGQIVGYLCGVILGTESYRKLRSIAELECMFVRDTLRGQGVGRRLAEAFLDWARAQGVARVMVVACATNRGATEFYRRMGFSDFDLVLERDL